VNEEEFQKKLDKCRTEQERQALITSTLNGLYSESADAYRENNAEVIAANKAQDNLNATLAKIGGIIEPVITKGKQVLTQVLEKVTPYIEDLAQTVIPFLMDTISLLVDWLDKAIKTAKDAIKWVDKNRTTATLLAVALGTLAVAVGAYRAAELLKTIAVKAGTAAEGAGTVALGLKTVALKAATNAGTAFGSVMSFQTSPITLVVVAIGALIAAGVLLVKNWDTVKAAAFRVWSGIKSTFSGVGAWFSRIWTDALNRVKSIWGGLTGWFRSLMTGVKNVVGTIGSGIASAFKAPVNGVISLINGFIRGLNGIKIPDWVPGVGGKGFHISQLPYLEKGGILEKGQVGVLEGNGAEAVVPLERNQKWISAVAKDMRATGIGGDPDVVQQLLDAFLDFVDDLPRVLDNAAGDQKLVLNNREFGRIVKAVM
jgi:phage-related protein